MQRWWALLGVTVAVLVVTLVVVLWRRRGAAGVRGGLGSERVVVAEPGWGFALAWLIGILAAAGAVIYLALNDEGLPEGDYVPPREVNGVVIPGHTVPVTPEP